MPTGVTVPLSSKQRAILGPYFFCLSCFESLYGPCGAVKEGGFFKLCET